MKRCFDNVQLLNQNLSAFQKFVHLFWEVREIQKLEVVLLKNLYLHLLN